MSENNMPTESKQPAQPSEQAEEKQPLDPKMTIEVNNDELEELLVNYAKEQNVEALNKLVKHIHSCRVLVPANLTEDKKPVPCYIRNQNEQMFLPIYTSKKHIPQEPKSPAMMNMPFITVNKLVATGEPKCDGIVINAFTNNLIFKTELVKRIAEVDDAQRKLPKPQLLKLSPQEYVLFERNQFEYRYLPKKFFELGQEFVDAMCEQRENYLDQLYESSYQHQRLYGFLEDEFAVMPLTINDELLMIRIDMPIRDMNANSCERVYLSWKKNEKKGRYFAIAKAKGGTILLEVTPEGEHLTHGRAPVEGAELQALIDLVNDTQVHTS